MTVAILLAFAIVASPILGEMIFRGQCTRIFQPQEIAITVDMADVVFHRYIIQPTDVVNSQSNCVSRCLTTNNPPCRTVIYQPTGGTCILLRADKMTAMQFDNPPDISRPLFGILIAPQSLTDVAVDRLNGITNCASFCPAPAFESADTLTPVCLADCAASKPVCAGEEAGCFDYPRSLTYGTNNVLSTIGTSTANAFKTFTFLKKYDFTNVRVTMSMQIYIGTISTGQLYDVIYFTATIGNYSCVGEKGYPQQIGKGVTALGHPFYLGEPIGGELLCTGYEIPAGSYQLAINGVRKGSPSTYLTVDVPASFFGAQSSLYVHAEEYVPTKWNFKLDDSARCQAATVFNTQSAQWSISYANMLGITPYQILKFKKRSDTSTLRIYWHGNVLINATSLCLHFYYTINDNLCSNPYNIETSFYYDLRSAGWSCRIDIGARTVALDGICRGQPAGRYDIALWVDTMCPGITHGNSSYTFDIGWGYNSEMFVEEINENSPTNSLLLSDGTLANLPYYNRQYFVWNTFCSNAGTCTSSCDTSLNCVKLPFKTFTFKKLQSASNLHIKWYGGHQFCNPSGYYNEAIKWYVRINGQDCSSPAPIESWWIDRGVSGGTHQACPVIAKYVEGICSMAIPAGETQITLQIGLVNSAYPAMGHGTAAGLGGHSYLMVEEAYPM